VDVKGVYLVETGQGPTPVVLLEDDLHRIMPIYIGLPEAISIHSALNKEVPPRPMTHDLFISLVEQLGSRITSILIDELSDGIYYARLTVTRNGSSFELDARPSDCLALALRANAPISVREAVIREAAVSEEEIRDAVSLDNYLR